ncbi:hypothetical protein ACOME3_007447 [Neoechinorhynchus agilis]
MTPSVRCNQSIGEVTKIELQRVGPERRHPWRRPSLFWVILTASSRSLLNMDDTESSQVYEQFKSVAPGIKRINICDFSLLGSCVFKENVPKDVTNIFAALSLLCKKCSELKSHEAVERTPLRSIRSLTKSILIMLSPNGRTSHNTPEVPKAVIVGLTGGAEGSQITSRPTGREVTFATHGLLDGVRCLAGSYRGRNVGDSLGQRNIPDSFLFEIVCPHLLPTRMSLCLASRRQKITCSIMHSASRTVA